MKDFRSPANDVTESGNARDSCLLTDVSNRHDIPVLFLSQEEGLCLSWGDAHDCPLSLTRNGSHGDDIKTKRQHSHFECFELTTPNSPTGLSLRHEETESQK